MSRPSSLFIASFSSFDFDVELGMGCMYYDAGQHVHWSGDKSRWKSDLSTVEGGIIAWHVEASTVFSG